MDNPNYIFRFPIFVAALILAITGCAGSIPQNSSLAQNWGRSFETQRHLQAANPEAGKQPAVMMMDGASADTVVHKYRKSFGADDQKETVNIIKLK
jgi:hypothetical protein